MKLFCVPVCVIGRIKFIDRCIRVVQMRFFGLQHSINGMNISILRVFRVHTLNRQFTIFLSEFFFKLLFWVSIEYVLVGTRSSRIPIYLLTLQYSKRQNLNRKTVNKKKKKTYIYIYIYTCIEKTLNNKPIIVYLKASIYSQK